ncbi:MAG: ABC transporter permease subunit, partial [Anaerolineales bacterium]
MNARTAGGGVPTGLNWALWLGGLITLATVLLAIFGPGLAPFDPLKEHFITEIGDDFIRAPWAPFQAPGFPLGGDEFGRDILSRLLWAVQPTLTLVLVVAALRLTVGLAVGVIAGWTTGRVSRALEWITALALAVPVLFVALGMIAATGGRWGVGAFILGLTLTSWGETARTVREQTRLIQQQRYVESARALGASGAQIILRHVLPHLLPLAWVLLAIEASSALLTTAALGFLGYFVNAVWIPISDFTGIRAAGRPDLGQLLAYSHTQPWSALIAGLTVIIIVLGLNLMGEGLREALSPERRRRTNRWLRPIEAMRGWMEDRFFMTEWRRALPLGAAVGGLLAVVFGGGWWLYAQTVRAEAFSNAITTQHLWPSSQHDAQGTLWSPQIGPASVRVLWQFGDGAPISAPVIAADGTLYTITARDEGTLYALTPDGAVSWQARLPFPAAILSFTPSDFNERPPSLASRSLAAPALNSRGDVIVVGEGGALVIFTAQGRELFAGAAPAGGLLLVNPIVGPDDSIYVGTETHLLKFSADGPLQLRAPLPTYSYTQPVLRLTADGNYIALQDVLAGTRTGEVAFTAKNSIEIFLTGADGKTYVQTQDTLDEWVLSEANASVSTWIRLDVRSLGLSFRPPADAGVLPDGRSWVWFLAFFGTPKLVWTEIGDSVSTPIDVPLSEARLIALDRDAVAYVCGRDFTGTDQFA